ncbi:hypothetical protein GQX74_008434 [Glossina fuscipes]|nr:hypothetical protein GQX74_008434 [Glossina fuscipes]
MGASDTQQLNTSEPPTFGSTRRLHSHCITGITSLYTAVACDCVINPAGAVFFTSSASSIKNEQNVLRHCEAAANEAAFIALEPNSQHSPQRESISISNRPFSVQAGEQAIAKNRRKTFTTVSSLFVIMSYHKLFGLFVEGHCALSRGLTKPLTCSTEFNTNTNTFNHCIHPIVKVHGKPDIYVSQPISHDIHK